MTMRWKCGNDGIPVAVECPQVGWPHMDASGEQQYDNTHFDTEAEAWEIGMDNHLAGISLLGGEIERLEDMLSARRQEVGASAVAWKKFHRAHERFKRMQERETE